MKQRLFFLLCWVFLAALPGCYQMHESADDLPTVPVTNNPNILPNQGGGMRMPSAPM